MTEKDVLKIFKDTGAFMKGHFLLSSGLHSGEYLQCALVLQHPEHSEALCKELAKKFKDKGTTVVIGPALGGVTLSYEMGRQLGVRSIFAERQDGKMALRRGFNMSPDDKVLVVEDVITTGGSTKEVIELVKSAGAGLIGVASVIDRSSKGVDFGAPYHALAKVHVQTFPPQECLLCKEGSKPVKPGSKKQSLSG